MQALPEGHWNRNCKQIVKGLFLETLNGFIAIRFRSGFVFGYEPPISTEKNGYGPVDPMQTSGVLISDNVQQAHVVSHCGAENGYTTTGGEP